MSADQAIDKERETTVTDGRYSQFFHTFLVSGGIELAWVATMKAFQFIVSLCARPGKAHGEKNARCGYQRKVRITPRN